MNRLSYGAVLLIVSAVATSGTAADPELWLSPLVRPLAVQHMGPFVRMDETSILTVDKDSALISRDNGRTWSTPIAMFAQQEATISNERAIVRTGNGAVVVAFMNLKDRSKGYWDAAKNDFVPDVRLNVWTARSEDGGQSWSAVQCVQQGYSGAVRALVQAANGNLVLATQDVLRDPARHVTRAYFSRDVGRTWQPAAHLSADGNSLPHFDLGGHGHHDGAIEPTVELLDDGRLWMLIRTGNDWFWEAFSEDHGQSWSTFQKSKIKASAAPGMLKRLASGRLLLAWNRLYPEGKESYARKGPPWHKEPASYHREELSVALSEDEGRTWSSPVVVARQAGKWLSYPYVFEASPGEIWLTTMQGGLRLSLRERDLLEPTATGAFQVETHVGIENVCAWPNLTMLPEGVIAAVIHNRPSHGGMAGDVECWVSTDGVKWEKRGHPAPNDPDTVRMNVAAGLAASGDLLVLCSGWTNIKHPNRPKQAKFRDDILSTWVCRSSDGGRTWSQHKEFPKPKAGWTEFIPFGDIEVGSDGSLHASCYGGPFIDPTKSTKIGVNHAWHFRSDDDGRTWRQVSIIGPRHNETHLLQLGAGKWLAAARSDAMDLFRSDDDGVTWKGPQRVTGRNEINGHLLRLADKRLVLTYGNRVKDQYGVMAKVSSDEGLSWSEPLRLAHTLGGDCGYPSSVQRADGRIVTAYYASRSAACDHYHMATAIWTPPK